MKNRAFVTFLAIASFLLTASVATAGDTVPTEVAERFTAAGMLDENEDFVGTFTLTTKMVIQKTNGKGRKEEAMVIEVSRAKDGTTQRRLLSLLEDGEDVTEKRREKVEKKFAENSNKEEAAEGDEDLVSPFGETAEKYNFGEIKNEGAAALLSFEPKPEYREEEGMAQGTISWNKDTLDPLWIEMTALTAPSPLKEFDMRMEFTRKDGSIFMNRLFTTGTAKVLLFTREFEADVRISEVEAESPDPN